MHGLCSRSLSAINVLLRFGSVTWSVRFGIGLSEILKMQFINVLRVWIYLIPIFELNDGTLRQQREQTRSM